MCVRVYVLGLCLYPKDYHNGAVFLEWIDRPSQQINRNYEDVIM